MIEEISYLVHAAEKNGKKIAMFHFQVLVNAKDLKGLDAVQFCRDIRVPESYATEFRKMISLSSLMNELGFKISNDMAS